MKNKFKKLLIKSDIYLFIVYLFYIILVVIDKILLLVTYSVVAVVHGKIGSIEKNLRPFLLITFIHYELRDQ